MHSIINDSTLYDSSCFKGHIYNFEEYNRKTITMAQQTAMQWLEDRLIGNPHTEMDFMHNRNIFEQAKQMEKEQIITAASIGILWGEDEKYLQSSIKFGEEYYDRTFTLTPQGENPSATRI